MWEKIRRNIACYAAGIKRMGLGRREAAAGSPATTEPGVTLPCVADNPIVLDPAWLTAEVLSLARAASEVGLPEQQGDALDTQRLAVLADALEEAGAFGELVDHLRGPGPHVWGCFAVDLLTRRK